MHFGPLTLKGQAAFAKFISNLKGCETGANQFGMTWNTKCLVECLNELYEDLGWKRDVTRDKSGLEEE